MNKCAAFSICGLTLTDKQICFSKRGCDNGLQKTQADPKSFKRHMQYYLQKVLPSLKNGVETLDIQQIRLAFKRQRDEINS